MEVSFMYLIAIEINQYLHKNKHHNLFANLIVRITIDRST